MKTTIIITISILLLGCRTGKTVTERIVKETDSTALWELRDSLQVKTAEIALLKTDLKRVREENVRLQSEELSYEVKYDTAAPVVLETGKPPVMSERIATHNKLYEKEVTDVEQQQKEWSLERESLTQERSSLLLSVDKLSRENRELKEKTSPSICFNFNIFLAGVIASLCLCLIACRLCKMVI